MKEIKEIFRFTLYAQPVPEALSVISVRSALPLATGGTQEFLCALHTLCAACAGGTFCDFREFLCDL